MTALYVSLGVLVLLATVSAAACSQLAGLRSRVKSTWSQMDMQLKRRHALIPGLLDAARNCMKHEIELLDALTQAHNFAARTASSAGEASYAEGALSGAIRQFFLVAESSSELRADTDFLSLQEELMSTESKISFSSHLYNDSFLKYNNRLEAAPMCVVAGVLAFKPAEFFELEDVTQRDVPKMSF